MTTVAIYTLLVLSSISLAAGVAPGPLLNFKSPDATYRPKFRYWQVLSKKSSNCDTRLTNIPQAPDANSDIETVVGDIDAVSQVGGGGILLNPFYNFGFAPIPNELPYSAWDEYAFGSEAFKDVFRAALDASSQRNLTFDFQIGASQGQGVPSPPLTPGLAVHLVYGQTSVPGGETFEGRLPEDDPEALNLGDSSIAQFMHSHEDFGPRKLVGVVSAGLVSGNSTSENHNEATTLLIDESSLVDLTEHVIDNQLIWTAPSDHHHYILFTFYERYTNQRSCDGLPNANSLIVNGSWVTDHFSAAGAGLVIKFWEDQILDNDMKQLLRDVGEHTFEDSMETSAALFWSEDLVERFKRINGYSPIKYLPLLFNKLHTYRMDYSPYNTTYTLSGDDSTEDNVYLQDYRKTLSDGYNEYLATYESWAQSLGMSHSAQPAYHLPLDMPGAATLIGGPELESLAFPEIDHPLQFVGGVHLSGSNLVSSELGAIFPSYRHKVSEIMHLFKTGYAASVNVMVIHGMTYSGEYHNTTWPGYTTFQYLSGEQWGPRLPAWKYLDDFMNWAGRTQLALQTGTTKRDVAFYLYKEPWSATAEQDGSDLRSAGFSYEYLGPSNLALPEAVVVDGVLAPDGPAYKALVFDNQDFISEEAAQTVLEFAHKQFPIIIKGSAPRRSIGTLGQEAVAATMSALRDSDNVRFIEEDEPLPDVLGEFGVIPRVSVSLETPSPHLWSVWRQTEDSDVVYLYNGNETQTFDSTFAVSKDQIPYWLDAWTGEQHPLQVYQRTESGLSVSLTLKSDQATIISFSKSCISSGIHITSHSENVVKVYAGSNHSTVALVDGSNAASLTLSNGHQVEIPGLNSISTSENVELGLWNLTLESWVPSSDPSVTRSVVETIDLGLQETLRPWSAIERAENVSGVGIYTATLKTPPNYVAARAATIINFGPVLNTLRVWVNDKLLPPMDNANAEMDIAEYLHSGENEIRIEVSSTLFNAVKVRASSLLSGGLPIMDTEPYDVAEFQEHGLIGPVTLKTLRKEVVSL